MTRRLQTLILSLAVAVPSLFAEGGDSVRVSANPFAIDFGEKVRLVLNGYGQSVYQLSSTPQEKRNDFQVQRAILIGNAMVGKRLRAMVMVDAAATRADRHLHEYYLEYTFDEALKLRVGQYKQPFMLENIYIPTILGAVNMTEGTKYMAGIAGDAMQGNMVGRDQGIMVSGNAFKQKDGHHLLSYSLGLFNGCGLNQRDNNRSKDLVGMVQVFPTRNWQLTSSFILGRGHAVAASPYGDIAEGENYRRSRWSIGTEWKPKPLQLRSELTLGWNGSVRSRAFYAEAWIHTLPQLDIVLNYDHLNRNTNEHGPLMTAQTPVASNNYTFGLQYWIWRRCRIASQYVLSHHDVGKDSHLWVTQFQFEF